MALPRIAISSGDPAGVGPEICLKAIADSSVQSICHPLLLGDLTVFSEVARRLSLPLPQTLIPFENRAEITQTDQAAIWDFQSIALADFPAKQVNARTGESSFRYFSEAITLAQERKVGAVVTGPIHKEAINAAGHHYPGHTEIIADRVGTDDFCMMLTSDLISCSFVTTHVGLYEVPGLLSIERILKTIRLTDQALAKIRGRSVKLVCCALNPHAGEGGMFGQDEESKLIEPAVELAQAEGIQIDGPVAADTAFIEQRRAQTDGYVCMYHDQGNIPLKALAFDQAVNVTLGLPLVRTSVDHGTACDIAWEGIANHQSMVEAIKLAVKLCGSSSL